MLLGRGPFTQAIGQKGMTVRGLTILMALTVAGCSTAPQGVQLRDASGHVVECKADPWAVWSWDIPRWQEECAQKYERNGFERMK